ncbi:MAG: peptide chain release factor N(5)-glutamine methyltransferase [Candidatus Aceula lacicola]|nr:peptide chain release factor N(5)-glutamine methyltransferase [Candidatus Aceula lacicola]
MTEQELILTSVLDCRRVDLYAKKICLLENQKKKLGMIKERRLCGEPVQYILGFCDFMGLDFLVNLDVLIPRPETEILVENVLKSADLLSERNLRVLDIGTGSGNIVISLAKARERLEFVAIDISQDALNIAKQNVQRHGVGDKIKFICSDVLENQEFLRNEEKFDIIISNPPYIKSEDISGLPKEVQKEPKLALDGGADGLDFYRAIAKKGSKLLKGKGLVFLEIGDGQEKEVESIFNATAHFDLKDCLCDYSNTKRIIILEKRNV